MIITNLLKYPDIMQNYCRKIPRKYIFHLSQRGVHIEKINNSVCKNQVQLRNPVCHLVLKSRYYYSF
jgi:hypothetical protein